MGVGEDIELGNNGTDGILLFGTNACGKSTFMKILSGEQEASSGEVFSLASDCRLPVAFTEIIPFD